MSKNKKRGVCKVKYYHGVTLSNFRMAVKSYSIAKICYSVTKKAGQQGLYQFFAGLIQGNDDWFHYMNITDEQFLIIYKELDVETLKREAQETINRIMEAIRKKQSGIILPKGAEDIEVKAAKEIFDKHLSIGGGRR